MSTPKWKCPHSREEASLVCQGSGHEWPRVCGNVPISRGTSNAWRCWQYFKHRKLFLPDLRGHHILVRSETHWWSYILRSRHTELMEQIWKKFGQAQVDFRKPWLLYRRRSHPHPPWTERLKYSFFSFFFFFYSKIMWKAKPEEICTIVFQS